MVTIDDASRIGEARRIAVALAADAGLDETARGEVALVVTELGANLSRHATGGRILVGATRGRTGAVDVLSIDDGPGMADVQDCLRDGFSTAGTPGTGLGAVRRLARDFSIYSAVGRGTVILARVARARAADASRASRFEVGAIALAAPGESECGDGWSMHVDGPRAVVMLADGLGHGPLAAEVAARASDAFDARHDGSPGQTLAHLHEALVGTRGAAVAVAALDADAGSIEFAGAGNVVGRLVSGIEDRGLMSQHGTVGLRMRRPHDLRYAWHEHAVLVLHTDGVATRWSLADDPGLLRCDAAVIAAWLIRDQLRGKDDATVVVMRRSAPRGVA